MAKTSKTILRKAGTASQSRTDQWHAEHDPIWEAYCCRVSMLRSNGSSRRVLMRLLFRSKYMIEYGLLQRAWRRLGADSDVKNTDSDQFGHLYDAIMTGLAFASAKSDPAGGICTS